MKQCNKCLQDLDNSAFGRHSGANFLRPECKKCTNRLNKERRELKKKYGVAPADHVCPICLRNEEEVRGLGGVRIGSWVLDHDHKTAQFRGWLCHSCNRGLGGFNDDVQKLKRARHYLNPSKWWTFWK